MQTALRISAEPLYHMPAPVGTRTSLKNSGGEATSMSIQETSLAEVCYPGPLRDFSQKTLRSTRV